ncbi:hypothetical protein ACJJID_12740 [Microbulbifer sp. CnH-101-G]|uniref:hypothetical protein n=1 Tax=Microbulbifer sp. CnH-101-G TaxID=3243393 RepID=UPI00403A6083
MIISDAVGNAKKMKIVFKEPYAYLLVQDDNNWYLTVFTGGPFEIDICVKFTEEEVNRVSSSQVEAAKLAQKFQQNRDLYKGRRVVPSVVPGR